MVNTEGILVNTEGQINVLSKFIQGEKLVAFQVLKEYSTLYSDQQA